MYEHILVAIDGSRLSAPAIRTAFGLAKLLRARLTALYVVAPYAGAGAAAFAALPGYRRGVRKNARRALAGFNAEARAEAVAARAVSVVGGAPWRQILLAARVRKCDLIVMASHGRSGLAGVLLGSETTKVLTHSNIPVLVCR